MATLVTQEITRLGVGPTYAAAAGGGDSFTPGDDTFLHVKNAGGGAITVTVATPGASPIPNVTYTLAGVSVPATTGERMIGPFPKAFFADATDGLADITYSGVASVTIGVFRVGEP